MPYSVNLNKNLFLANNLSNAVPKDLSTVAKAEELINTSADLSFS